MLSHFVNCKKGAKYWQYYIRIQKILSCEDSFVLFVVISQIRNVLSVVTWIISIKKHSTDGDMGHGSIRSI